ncbi:hypothetical protein [Alcanivorax sp.]|uniref:hypothetical protein n=1 Tax=Alcanivorax sp. TaxID=1872427 RepID=UPI0025B9CA63|nr:hypothetical protein [Alcanivorax sp.]
MSEKRLTPLCPRQQRLLKALLGGEVTREQADRIAKASNGPAVVGALRERGLDIPCERREKLDDDGKKIRPGIYSLESKSIPLAKQLLAGVVR